MELQGVDPDRRRLLVREALPGGEVEREIRISPLEPPSLVEVVVPDQKKPWESKTESTSFRLDRVTSVELEEPEGWRSVPVFTIL
jgi:hypothetical protein